MSPLDETVVECSDGSLRRTPEGAFEIVWDQELIESCPSLAEALASFSERCGDYSGPLTYGLGRNAIWEAAEHAGVEEIAPYSRDGWVRYDGVWLPGGFLPDYDGPHDSFPEVVSFGELGCEAAVYQWENVFLTIWHGPEWEGKGFSIEVNKTLEEVSADAEGKAFDIQADWNLLYDEYVGLGNLSEIERFPLPNDVQDLGTVESCLYEWGDVAASVEVHYWEGGGETPFLVSAASLVVGRYASLDELRDQIDPGDAFAASELSLIHI